jgi:cytochrome c oxidase subunit 2
MLSRNRAIGLTLAAVAALLVGATKPAPAHPSIDIVASNWKFTPATIEAHVGEETTLRITSSEGVHGVESTDVGIDKTTILPGKFVEVKFTPKKAGTFKVQCAIVCGEGHDAMLLTVKVLPAS